MSNDFYDGKGPIDLTDKEQADFWERQTKGMSKALSEFKAIVRAKSEQIKTLEAKNVELEKKLQVAEGEWKTYATVSKSLSKKLKIAVEALEFMKQGCLVPPDGGSPDIPDYINCASEALAAINGENV